MLEFIRGIRMPLSTTWIPACARISSNNGGNFASRSRIRYLTMHPVSSRSMTNFLAAWATRAVVGWAVVPSTRTRRVVYSMTARMY
jgi:hypothetical protein